MESRIQVEQIEDNKIDGNNQDVQKSDDENSDVSSNLDKSFESDGVDDDYLKDSYTQGKQTMTAMVNGIIDEEIAIHKKSKVSISAEAFGQFNRKSQDYQCKFILKSKETIDRIHQLLKEIIIFKHLNEKDMEILINAMEELHFAKTGETVIQQGDSGDCLYIVDDGTLVCHKQIGGENKFLKKYMAGELFGELALFYNSPRAATIKTDSESVVLYSLDRQTFNHIVMDSSLKRRQKYEDFLRNVKAFKDLDEYEIGQIADAVKEEEYKKDDQVIKQGDVGNQFFIITEGEVTVTKSILSPTKSLLIPSKASSDDLLFEKEELKHAADYTVGDYFGERSLLKDDKRAANVIVKSDILKVLSLDRQSFIRLLGPFGHILRRSSAVN